MSKIVSESSGPRRRVKKPKLQKSSSQTVSSETNKTPNKKPTSARSSQKPKVPVVVIPGKWHEVAAALLLKGIEALADRNGVKLDMGTVKPVSEYVSGPSDGPTPEPMDVAPRVIAHVVNRIPGIRKLGKMSEDKGAKSGFLTDLTTLAAQLLERNEELVVDKGEEIVVAAFHPNKASQGQSQQTPEIRDVVIVDEVPLQQPIVE